MKKILALLLVASKLATAQEIEKPFIKEHEEHKHKIDFTNVSVFQAIRDYSTIYNSIHIFFSYNFNPNNLIFVHTGVSFGNGLNKKLKRLGYSITSTADDLEDDLRDINGTGRKYLLEAFYQFNNDFINLSFGIIDSTSFIDSNEYANDEHIQFLNPVLVNNPIALLPSYNLGVNLNIRFNNYLSTDILYMRNKPDSGNVGIFEMDLSLNNLNLRPYYYYLFGSSEVKGIGISADYTYKNLGFFFRYGKNNTDFKNFKSFGVSLDFNQFGNIGLGYGFMYNNPDNDNVKVVEFYHKYNFNKQISFSTDIQFLKEERERLVYGFRLFFKY